MPLYVVRIVEEREVRVDAADAAHAAAGALSSLRAVRDRQRPTSVRAHGSDVEREVVTRCESCDRYLLAGDDFVMGEDGDLCAACCAEIAEAG